MTQKFKRNIVTFLLLNLVFALILLIGLSLFGDITMELFAYLFWFLIIFGSLATLIQTAIFTLFFSKLRLSSFLFFVTAFIIELILVNILVAYVNGGNSLTGDLIRDMTHPNGRSISVPLFIHVAFLLATLIIALTRTNTKALSV